MNRRMRAAGLVVVVMAVSAAAQRQTFKGRADLVTVQVAVETGSTPVTDLTARDFEVTDNGVQQRLDMIDAGSVPIDVSVVLDTSGSMERWVEGLRSDAQAIAAMLHPDDRLRLITFAGDATEAFGFRKAGGDLDVSHVAAAGWTALFDAIALAMMTPREPDRRHLVVVLTDGDDNSSILGSGSALDDLSKRTDAVLYAAVTPAPPSHVRDKPPRPLDAPAWGAARWNTVPPAPRHNLGWSPRMIREGDRQPLRLMVENTGGIWDGVGRIERAEDDVRRAIEWFRSAYVIRYRATGVTSTAWHAIGVKVTRPGSYTIRARKGYFGG